MCGSHRFLVASVVLGIWMTGARLVADAQASETADSGSVLTTLLSAAAAAGMGWFAALKRAELMRFILPLLTRLGGILPGKLRELLKLTEGRSLGGAPADESAKTMVVQRGPFGVIICVSPPLCGKRWEIPAQGLAIGRDPSSDIVVDDSRVSAQHAQIRPTQRGVVVVDSASKNGVFLNDAEHRVKEEAVLKPGDVVMLSPTEAAQFVFCSR